MKAIRVHEFGDPEVMQVEEVPDPRPGPGQVVVKIRAIGINPVDTYIRSGLYHTKPQLPYTPGNDAAGIIESIGEGVNHVSIGDRVYTAGSISGTYAEQALCDAVKVHTLPEKISFTQGAGRHIRPHFMLYFTAPGPFPVKSFLFMAPQAVWVLLRFNGPAVQD